MRSQKRELVPSTIVLLLLLIIYLGFATQNYYWDGIEFAQTIEDAESFNTSLMHPNHLIYNFFGFAIYKAVQGIGIDARSISVLQVTNSILSALAALVLFQILKFSFRSTYYAVGLTSLFAFSDVWWKFSTDANSYIPSILFVLISFYFVLPGKKARPFIVALTHSIAMCFHQLAVFFVPVVALGIYLQTSGLTARERLLKTAQYGIMAFLVTFGSFCFLFNLQTGSKDISSLFQWLTSYSPENGFVFILKDCIKHTVSGDVKLFFGGRFNFIKEIMSPFTILVIIAGIVALVGLVIQILRGWRLKTIGRNPESKGQFKSLFWLCLIWAGVYHVFLFFWIPQNTFYRMFYLPPFIILIGIFLARFRLPERHLWRLPLFVGVMATSNFLFLIYPYSFVRKETPLELALKMNSIWSTKTVVYYARAESDNKLIRYFNPSANWKKLPEHGLDKFEIEVQNVHEDGGDVWIETTALSWISKQESGAEWLKTHSPDQNQYRLNDPAYNVMVAKVVP